VVVLFSFDDKELYNTPSSVIVSILIFGGIGTAGVFGGTSKGGPGFI
jgi:hypothetical protein